MYSLIFLLLFLVALFCSFCSYRRHHCSLYFVIYLFNSLMFLIVEIVIFTTNVLLLIIGQKK